MKTELRLAAHEVLPGQKTIELWHDGRLIGCVYGADGPGVRIVSKHPVSVCGPAEMVTEVKIDPEEMP